MRTGVLGGTFDPIHVGHLRAAESVREALALDEVLFVPARQPPHRTAPRAAALDRYAMVALATSDHPAFRPCDLELDREGPSYTVDTLAALRQQRPERELVLIVGSDALADLPGWRESERIFALARVAAVRRPDAEEADPGAPGSVEWVSGPTLEISSTGIRERLARGGSVRYWVPPAVADYIARRGLYT